MQNVNKTNMWQSQKDVKLSQIFFKNKFERLFKIKSLELNDHSVRNTNEN